MWSIHDGCCFGKAIVYVRLTGEEVDAIRKEIKRMDPGAQVYLFGSRVDDAARGGDIDLWVRSERITYRDLLLLRIHLQDRLGWRRIDVILNAGDDHPLATVVAETGIQL